MKIDFRWKTVQLYTNVCYTGMMNIRLLGTRVWPPTRRMDALIL